MRHMVRYQRVVIDVLLLVSYHATVARALSPLAYQVEVQLITCHSVMQRDDVMVHSAVSLLLDIYIAHTGILVVRLLQTIEVQLGILTHKRLDNLSSQETTIVSGMVTK